MWHDGTKKSGLWENGEFVGEYFIANKSIKTNGLEFKIKT